MKPIWAGFYLESSDRCLITGYCDNQYIFLNEDNTRIIDDFDDHESTVEDQNLEEDENIDNEDRASIVLNEVERQEIAKYMMERWAEYGELTVEIINNKK